MEDLKNIITPEALTAAATIPADPKKSAHDPFNPSSFRANSTTVGSVGVIKELVICPVRKPGKQEFVRVHPDEDYKLVAHILELKDDGEVYLFKPEVAAALPGETRLVSLRLAASRQGAIFLWPVPELTIEARQSNWHHSIRKAAAMAEKDWVRVIANMPQGMYDIYTAPGALGSPMWPDRTLRDILEIAFGKSFVIEDASHPVIKRLLGGA